jgi:hypothetical protein
MRADNWTRASLARRITRRIRERVSIWLFDGYDRKAGRIVDAALADQDRLAEEVRELRARLGECQEDIIQ